jgi:hypothetical protein
MPRQQNLSRDQPEDRPRKQSADIEVRFFAARETICCEILPTLVQHHGQMIFLARREIAETRLDDRTGDCLAVPTLWYKNPSWGEIALTHLEGWKINCSIMRSQTEPRVFKKRLMVPEL